MIKNQYMHEQVHELLFWMSLSVWPSVSELNIPVSGKSNIEGSNKVYGMYIYNGIIKSFILSSTLQNDKQFITIWISGLVNS